MTKGILAAVGGLALSIAMALPASAAGLEGVYKLQGWNPGSAVGGSAQYDGTFTVVKKGPGYEVKWVTGGATSVGIAIERVIGGKRMLLVGYDGGGGVASVASYEVSADGKLLNGEWFSNTGMGHERLTR